MSETQRCEPKDTARDGWHWVQHPSHDGPRAIQWWSEGHWTQPGILPGECSPEELWAWGYRYVASVPTPAEIAALVEAARKALDALLAREAGNVDELYSEPEETVLVDLINSLAAFPAKETPDGR